MNCPFTEILLVFLLYPVNFSPSKTIHLSVHSVYHPIQRLKKKMIFSIHAPFAKDTQLREQGEETYVFDEARLFNAQTVEMHFFQT